MKVLKRVIGLIATILILNFLVTLIFVNKNEGEKYVDEYINTAKQVEVHVIDQRFEGKFSHTSYMKYSIFFKGIFGGSQDYTFEDSRSNRYFKIMRFDKYGDLFRRPQAYKIEEEDLYVQVDPVQYDDPSYGTLENPILVFSYKGVNKKIFYNSHQKDSKGYAVKDENGSTIPVEVSLETSEEEYCYNVAQYLTYVMPKEEFKARFKE